MSIKEKIVSGIKFVIFVGIGVFLFFEVQNVLVAKTDAERMEQFYVLDDNSIDAVFLGTSHMQTGYSPMETFELHGISTYNLASAGQPIGVSYYLIQEALRKQNLKVVVLDVSNLFFEASGITSDWRREMDALQWSQNKKNMANDFSKKFEREGESEFSALVPIYYYHTRWKELEEEDFFIKFDKEVIMGYEMADAVKAPWLDVDMMNDLTHLKNEYYESTEIMDGMVIKSNKVREHSYSVEVPEENLEYLLKIKEICDEAGVELLLTKIPSVQDPEQYNSAWTVQRSEYIKNLCSEYQIEFLDLLYDEIEYMFDINTDFYDGGYHFNIRGATKVSDFFGQYLKTHYGIISKDNTQFSEKISLYDEKKEQAFLRTEQDMNSYLEEVLNYKKAGDCVFVAASADVMSGLDSTYVDKLNAIGFQMDFSQYDQGVYVACVGNDLDEYEEYSTLQANHGLRLDGATITLAAYDDGDNYNTSVIVACDWDEEEKIYQCEESNLTILIYNPVENEVRDCACFVYQNENSIVRTQIEKME